MGTSAQEVVTKDVEAKVDTFSIISGYLQKLQQLVDERDSLGLLPLRPAPNAYYYQMLSTPTLYSSPLHQMMSTADSTITDKQLQTLYSINRMLAELYARHPELVQQTEENIKNQGQFRSDINEKISVQEKLSSKVGEGSLSPTLDENIQVVTRRPNFWKINANTSFQLSQSHFTANWYKGGEDNFAGNWDLTIRANFNNQRKFAWDNTLELKLGAQTSNSDTHRSFRPTNNLLRYTTNFGYQAYKTLYYSCQIRMQTQILPNYRPNTDDLTTKILSPLDVTVGPGMKYNFVWGKKKRFSGTLNVAPLAYNLRYVGVTELARNYGLEEGKNAKHSFGPSATLTTTYKICDQITWNSNISWYSDYSFTRIDWTNDINFVVTKLISAKLYLYPRIDDSSPKYKNWRGRYFMFNENLGIGLNYSF